MLYLVAGRQTDNPIEPERFDETWAFHSRNVVRLIRECGVDYIETEDNRLFAVAGGPMLDDSDTENIVRAAIKVRAYAQEVQDDPNTTNYYVKIGLHTDKVIAGIVDAARMPFDIYAHALHMAERMNRVCAWGEINLSEHTYAYIKDSFECENWGSVDSMSEVHKPIKDILKKAVKKTPHVRLSLVDMYRLQKEY